MKWGESMKLVSDVNPIADSPDTNKSKGVLLHGRSQKLEEMKNVPV
mgnify:CR=1 FL=1